jgi:hypothetical protein
MWVAGIGVPELANIGTQYGIVRAYWGSVNRYPMQLRVDHVLVPFPSLNAVELVCQIGIPLE